MHSRLRLVAAVVLAGGAVAALLAGRGDNSASNDAMPATSDTRVAADAAPSEEASSPRASAETTAGELREVSEPQEAAAEAIAAWQQQDATVRDTRLATVATAAYREAAADIEPSRVPTSPLDSTGLRVEADGQALVDAQLEDGTTLVVLVLQVEDAWLVDDLLPVDDPDNPGAP